MPLANKDDLYSVSIDVEKDNYLALRKLLYQHGISRQDFFAYIMRLSAILDDRITSMLPEIKLIKSKNNIQNSTLKDLVGVGKTTLTPKELFDILEQQRNNNGG